MKNLLAGFGYPDFPLLDELKDLTIVYNKTGNSEDPELKTTDDDTLEDVLQIKNTLRNEPFKTHVFGLDEKNLDKYGSLKTDLVFNLCYGIGGKPDSEDEVYSLFEKSGIPYTGGPPETIKLTNDKSRAKKLFLENGLSTPGFAVIDSLKDLDLVNMKYPLFVKTLALGCSLGIDQDSVVENEKELEIKVGKLLGKYKVPLLVEEFLSGREFAVSVIGNGNDVLVMPVVEVAYGDLFEKKGRWKIFDYETKWDLKSPFYINSPYVCPAPLDPGLESEIREMTLNAYRLCGCNDYARADIRLDREGHPQLLELNLSPSIGRHSQIHKSAIALGLSFRDLIKIVISTAFKRYHRGE